jgi:CTP:molybdopterin cytidylyltransferase MocA
MQTDAAILIGDRGKSHPVWGQNKNFLEIAGMPLFVHVLRALERARSLKLLFVVGDRKKIEQALDKHKHSIAHPHRIIPLEQRNNLFANAMTAFEKASELASGKDVEGLRGHHHDTTMLYLPGDMPLVTAQEIDEFLDRCDPDRFDYCAGVTPEESLRPFYPREGSRGIRMAYFHLRQSRYRQNNLHLVKPLKVAHRHYVQKMYDYRYQKQPINIATLLWEFFRTNVGAKGIYCYLILHWNLLLSRLGLGFLTPVFRRLVSIETVERAIEQLLGCRFKIVETQMPGAALDVDNEKDYETLKLMYSRWRDHQESLFPRLHCSGTRGNHTS